MSEFQNNYPCIFVHGFGGFGHEDLMDHYFTYWGLFSKYLFPHLNEQGTECYNPALGAFNGTWDRTCILWAYLFGGTVDYGKVHSEKHRHARYGPTFEHGVLEDLGKTEAHKKINLFGHSFGGPTVIMAARLFAEGSQEERDGTDPDDLSPLFAGGHGNLIHTVTTLSGVNNGTALAELFGFLGTEIAGISVLTLQALLGDTAATRFYDIGCHQWGIGPERNDCQFRHIRNPLPYWSRIRDFCSNKDLDHCAREMQVSVQQDVILKDYKTDPGIYYFARRANGSVPDGKGGYKMKIPVDPLCLAAGIPTLRWMKKGTLAKYGFGTDPLWGMTDGFVNVRGQSAPIGTPQEDATQATAFAPGKWYNLRPIVGDHMTWMGWWVPKDRYFSMWDEMIRLNRSLPDGDAR